MNVEKRREIATARLQEVISRGQARAQVMTQNIGQTMPTDFLVGKKDMHFSPSPTGVVMHGNRTKAEGSRSASRGGEQMWDLHSNAQSQLNTRLKVPATFANGLLGEGAWGRELLAHTYNELVPHRGTGSRYLVRSVDGQARAVMSEKYKRVDSSMVLEGFVNAVQKHGGVISDAQVWDTRWKVSVVVPQLFEPIPGEVVGFGATLQNSDFGNGAMAYSFRILRLICLNGMIGNNELRKVHIGRELDGAVFSERTLRMQSKLWTSALGDVVNTSLSPKRIGMEMNRIKEAAETEIDSPQKLIKALQAGGKITKEEQDELNGVYVDGGIQELPQGNNVWRFSQALGRLAGIKDEKGEGERATELEKLAGEFMTNQIGVAA